jgi:cell shape-determining protein MreC
MVRKWRRSRPTAGRRGLWGRVAFAGLPLLALALVVLPAAVTERLRLWVSPILAPFHHQTGMWTLDLGEKPGGVTADGQPADLREQLLTSQQAVAELIALLDESDRQVHELSGLRAELEGLPCRLTPARIIPPEVAGGPATAQLSKGASKGVRKPGTVISSYIDRGRREAIERGDPVLLAAGLVGVVDEVAPLTSTIRLVTDPRLSLMVQVIVIRDGQRRAGPEGVARGTGDGASITVEGIPLGTDVAPGDFIVTSPSPESTLPPYLVVGRVVKCDVKQTDLFRTLVVEPRVTLAGVHEVYVLSPETSEGRR